MSRKARERDALTVDFVASDSSVRSVASIGRNSVAHATAVGKVFLAWNESLPHGELVAYSDQTITDQEALAAEVRQVRERGWANAVRECEPELNAVALPVLDGNDRLVAILDIQGPSIRFTESAVANAVNLLRERAALIRSAG